MAVYNDADKNKMLPEMSEGALLLERLQLLSNISLSRQLVIQKPL